MAVFRVERTGDYTVMSKDVYKRQFWHLLIHSRIFLLRKAFWEHDKKQIDLPVSHKNNQKPSIITTSCKGCLLYTSVPSGLCFSFL